MFSVLGGGVECFLALRRQVMVKGREKKKRVGEVNLGYLYLIS